MFITTVMSNNGLLSVRFEEKLETEKLRFSAEQIYDRETKEIYWEFKNDSGFEREVPADIKERMQKAVDILVKEF